MRNSRTFFYVGLALLMSAIFVGWLKGSHADFATSSGQLIAVGRLMGLIATVSVLLEVVLMSRIPFFERNFSLDEIIDLHKFNGYALLLSIVCHMIFLIIGYALPSHLGWWAQYADFNSNYEDVLNASLGTIIFFTAAFLSLQIVRKQLFYELWHLSHLVVYGAILLTWGHQLKTGADFIGQSWFVWLWYGMYAITFGLLVYYRFLKMFLYALIYNFKVVKVSQEGEGTYSIALRATSGRRLDFLPGQYATWRFLCKGLWYEAHPYSISSEPDSDVLKLTVKASGDYSKKVVKVPLGTKVLVDGPRGAFTVRQAENVEKVLLVAGGIGVAPYVSMIRSLIAEGKQVALLYAVSNTEHLAFKSELKLFMDEGLRVKIYDSSKGNRLKSNELIELAPRDCIVYLCGPDSMTNQLEKALRRNGHPKKAIITERFAF